MSTVLEATYQETVKITKQGTENTSRGSENTSREDNTTSKGNDNTSRGTSNTNITSTNTNTTSTNMSTNPNTNVSPNPNTNTNMNTGNMNTGNVNTGNVNTGNVNPVNINPTNPNFTLKLPNRLIITENSRVGFRRLAFFINRARKILRCDETLMVTGVDRAISMACVVVESLKRQKIAKVVKIATNMNLNPNFARFGGSLAWGRPAPTIVFHLERGDFATYVSDYQQRKVIEIFEKHDTHHTGKLSKKIVEDLNLADVFLANNDQREEAKKYLENVEEVDLPLFIRYCSALIHPLLRMAVFRDKLYLLGVGPQDDNTHLNEE